jgi:2-polyprenyl-6-methoxyphenol hydroxylase-like FAD-dependent oxidoreductase
MRTDRAGKAVTTMRAPFYEALLAAVAHAGITVQYGKRLTTLSDDGDEIVAHFEDGTSARGDFLVGADGVRSRVRALLLPDHAEPRYTGMLGIGGLAGEHVAIPDDGFARTLNFILGPRLSFGYAQMGAGAGARWGFWCHLPQEEELSRRALQAIPTDVMRERLQQSFAGWCDPVGPLLASTTTILRTALYEVPSLPSWSRGRAILIGDAAHAMSPAAGQGASLALEDAMLLGHLFAGAPAPVEDVFADFERRRRKRVESISAVAHDNDERSLQQLGAFGCWMRDRTFPLLAPLIARGLEKQYSAALI